MWKKSSTRRREVSKEHRTMLSRVNDVQVRKALILRMNVESSWILPQSGAEIGALHLAMGLIADQRSFAIKVWGTHSSTPYIHGEL
jgi:hypothetical protein